MSIDELVRWVISYQNFTGVTDKTKVVAKEKKCPMDVAGFIP